MPQRIKSTPALLSIKLMPMLLLVQWVGLMGSMDILNATRGWAAEETSADSSVLSEAASKDSSVAKKELTSSTAASEEAAKPSATATEKSSTAASPALIESSAAVSEEAASPVKATENPGSSTTEPKELTPSAVSEEPAVQPAGVSTMVKDLAISETETGKLVSSPITTTKQSVKSPKATFEPEAATQTISQATPDSTSASPEVASQPSVSTTTETTEPEVAPSSSISTPAPAKIPATSRTDSTNSGETYIDQTDYSIGATQPKRKSAANRPSVVLSERSTGRQITLPAGQGVAGSLGRSAAQVGKGIAVKLSRPVSSQSVMSSKSIETGTLSSSGMTPVTKISKAVLPRSVMSSIPLGRNSVSPSSSGVGLGSFTAGLSNYSNIKVSKWFVPSKTRIIFPLAIPVAITSAFGWRLHPIAGTWRFHSGTDLGAPIGTPVLAAYAGKVAIANALGGYGLAVVLDHNKGTQESLYGHLSEIMVKPGAWVEQGDVIGLVGSTGNSTGPHLHFEVRQSTPQGWVAVDPGQQLETALAQLVKALQTAQASNPHAGT